MPMIDPPDGLIEKILGAINGTAVGFLVQKPKSIKEFLIRGTACFIAGATLAATVTARWDFESLAAAAFFTSLVFWPLVGLLYNPQTLLELLSLWRKK